jgi:hypothetical protein
LAEKGNWRAVNNADGTIQLQRPGQTLLDKNETKPLDYIYRAVSEEDWEQIQKNGYMQSDGRLNIAGNEGTVATHRDPTFYAAQGIGEGGRVIRIQYNPADQWKVDSDSYLKTPNQIPISRIDAISEPTVGTGRSALDINDERLPGDLAFGMERRIVEKITAASDVTGVWGTDRGDKLRELADKIRNILLSARYGSTTNPDLDRLATTQDMQKAITQILPLLATMDFPGKDQLLAEVQQAQNLINRRLS